MSPPISPAQQELYKREAAKRRPEFFAQYVDPDFAKQYAYGHSLFIFEMFYKAATGTLFEGMNPSGKNIVILTLPPGHFKSSITNKCVAWWLGWRQSNKEKNQVALTSYGADLAETNSRTILDLIQEPLYENLFPDIELSRDRRGVQAWRLTHERGGGDTCKAVGTGGALTGHRANLMVIDDPHKDRDDANSLSSRNAKWSWWTDTARTRLVRGSLVWVILTRWHEDDLAGRIMARSKGDNVVLVRVPSIAETAMERQAVENMGLPVDEEDWLNREAGEAICPEIATAGELAVVRNDEPFTFDALYQGRPRRVGGNMVGREKFVMLDKAPTENIRWIWATDWAMTAKEVNKRDPDYTVIGLVGLWVPDEGEASLLVVADVKQVQDKLHGAKQMVTSKVLTMPGVGIAAFNANIDQTAMQDLERQGDIRAGGHRVHVLSRPHGDKLSLAQTWIELVEAGRFCVVRGEWNDLFFNEVEAFPNGKHDDVPDMVTVGHRYFVGAATNAVVIPHSLFDLTQQTWRQSYGH